MNGFNLLQFLAYYSTAYLICHHQNHTSNTLYADIFPKINAYGTAHYNHPSNTLYTDIHLCQFKQNWTDEWSKIKLHKILQQNVSHLKIISDYHKNTAKLL